MRTYKKPSIVSGKTIKDILNIPLEKFNALTEKELKPLVGRLVSAGNKRLRAFLKAGESSPAARHILQKSGGMFSVKGKGLNPLRKEFMRAKGFFESESGSLKSWRKVKAKTIKSLQKQGVNIDESRFNDFWEAYEDLKELSPSVANKKFKYVVLRTLADFMSDEVVDIEGVVDKVNRQITSLYEEQAIQEAEEDFDFSEFFEL